ncbi:hypothetical protein [Clostridium sp. MB40-C1]|uniref:hypothetical protein n=1 Tax=Clostridium sp. MB40-C1 TaxID=3070996 RepID=UPI0035A5F19F
MERLSLSFNRINDITPLKNLTNLLELHLCDNLMSDTSVLKNLTNLQWLYIFDEIHDEPLPYNDNSL